MKYEKFNICLEHIDHIVNINSTQIGICFKGFDEPSLVLYYDNEAKCEYAYKMLVQALEIGESSEK